MGISSMNRTSQGCSSGQVQKIPDLVVVDAAHQHGVQLQSLKSGVLRCLDAGKGRPPASPGG